MEYSIFVYSNNWMTNTPYKEREGEIYFHNIYSYFGIRIEIIITLLMWESWSHLNMYS